ncbi:hypothetical protein MtrunA17_Chr3g0111791 [Medicago truncatula]|uniref:Uncharacterized protein n=1 Tax=Medicago truncatula TaxID=3880 RepID=A0A396IW66_MEDTR|nr:hypothetical protein MtrunA17_Chr3g0111791 [Medicago truncatula]
MRGWDRMLVFDNENLARLDDTVYCVCGLLYLFNNISCLPRYMK